MLQCGITDAVSLCRFFTAVNTRFSSRVVGFKIHMSIVVHLFAIIAVYLITLLCSAFSLRNYK